jgi:uncharacterized protein YacL
MLKYDPYARRFAETPALQVILAGAAAGFLLAALAIALELFLHRLSLTNMAVIAAGLLIGALVAWGIAYMQVLLPDYIKEQLELQRAYVRVAIIAVYVLFAYIGVVVAVRGRKEFSLFMPRFSAARAPSLVPLLMDTSAIIDGRILELYKVGFLRNKIILPEFVLRELQLIADSQVPLTRLKGRRGLDILKRLQDAPNIEIEVINIDYPDMREVDDKLIRLAKEINASIISTDYNLEQVAKIQHINCLNLFGLVNALKAPFIPGERFSLQIVKEGSEPNQGIGFLDDGTMIVVANARPFVGQKTEIELVSMIQGASGRMFFAEVVKDKDPAASGPAGEHDRGYRGQERRRS